MPARVLMKMVDLGRDRTDKFFQRFHLTKCGAFDRVTLNECFP